jgi:hypothetical protein
MKKRTQAGGVNGPYDGRNRRKRKSEAARQSDFATFDSTLADDWPKRGGMAEKIRVCG